MTLVAVTAVGLGLCRRFSPEEYLRSFNPTDAVSLGSESPWTARAWALWAVTVCHDRYLSLHPLLATLTVTALALRVRQPRCRRARLLREPGVVACAAAISAHILWGHILVMQAMLSASGPC